jgi:hypothetical protein
MIVLDVVFTLYTEAQGRNLQECNEFGDESRWFGARKTLDSNDALNRG